MNNTLHFVLDGQLVGIDFSTARHLRPTTTVLQYLRGLPAHKGVKEGCAEGDCGACTVVIGEPDPEHGLMYRAVNSCLLLLPMLHGKQLLTVENLRSPWGALHPVQQALVDTHGSQCGFCTPGIVMSMFALYKQPSRPTRAEVEDALTGNLCRCTGYRSIVEAGLAACSRGPRDHLTEHEESILSILRSIPAGSIEVDTGDQVYVRPATLQEALERRAALPGAHILSGATDVALRITKSHEVLREVLDLGAIPELRRCLPRPEGLTIGACAPLTEVLAAAREALPPLAEMLSLFASQQIRNLASFGGNLGTASPVGDTLPILAAYGASVLVRSRRWAREIPIDEFVIGYRTTACAPDELIVGVQIPSAKGAVVRSYKVSKRKDLDIATVSAGFRIELDEGNKVKNLVLAYGGMAKTVRRARQVEARLIGRAWSRENIESAANVLPEEYTPLSDVRGSAEFRLLAARNLLVKFWMETHSRGVTP